MWARNNHRTLVGVSVLVFAFSSTAMAQGAGDVAVERARGHFAAGTSCMQEEDWSCAEARFRAALELHPAATIRYNLASVLYEQERFAESSRLAQQVLDDPEADRAIVDHALTLREQIHESGSVALVTAPGAPDEAELRVDGYAVPRAEWEAVPVAEGTHSFSLHRDGEVLTETSVDVSAGTPVTVSLTTVASPVEAAESSSSSSSSMDFDALLVDPIFWAVAGGGLVVVITIIVIIAVAAGGGTESPIEGDFEPGVLRW